MYSKQALEVIQATPNELSILLLSLPKSSLEIAYARIMKAYWRGQVDEIQQEIKAIGNPTSLEWQLLLHLAQLRKSIRTFEKLSAFPTSNFFEEEKISALWKGELSFVLAMYFETFDLDKEAKDHYLRARELLYGSDAKKKAVKAFHNAIACESRLIPSKRLIPDYQEVVSLARELGDLDTVGTALNNLAREFQLMKALTLAHRTVREAVELLRTVSYGSYQFYASLCNSCHINIELGHLRLAVIDYEEASMSPFPETKKSLVVLRDWLDERGCEIFVKKPQELNSEIGLSTWKKRKLEKVTTEYSLSDLESKLVQELTKGPRDRHQLIKVLWGEQADYFSLDNRLKQLIYRLRQKESSLVGFAEGLYFLVDDSSLNKTLKLKDATA